MFSIFGWILRAMAVGVVFLVIHGAQTLVGAGMPWWGSLVAAVAGYAAMAFLAKRLFMKAVTAPFQAKGAVLRGATLTVHSVAAVPAPVRARAMAMAGAPGESCGGCNDAGSHADDGEDAGAEDDPAAGCPEDWRWYCVDATVTPAGVPAGPFRHWAPGELILVGSDADTSPDAPCDDGSATIRSIEVCEDGTFVKDEGMKYEGEQRLRMTVACDPALRAAKLRYYFEGFGRIELSQG